MSGTVLVRVFFVALLVSGTAMQAQTPTLPALRIPDGFGLNIHFTRAGADELKALRASGARFIRMDFGWDGVERTKGNYDFSAYDGLVADMAKIGIRCLFILDYGNRLYDNNLSPHTDEGRAAFAGFAGAAARHFAGKGIFWEIWNEPNIGVFWKPKPNAEDYSAMALAAISAIRQADPNAFIMGPASSTFPWDFFDVMGKRGVFAKLDAVSVHPYRKTDPETVEADYARLRALLERYAPGRNIPLISGEWGYSTVRVSEEQQADYLTRQRLVNLSLQVPVSIWYDWKDDGADPKDAEHHFGTVYQNLKPKPSYIAGKVQAETLAGYRFVRRVASENPKDYVLQFRNGAGRVAHAVWTTAEAHSIKIDTAGNLTIVSRDGQRRSARSKGGMEIQLSASPQYILTR
ncbi:MAG: glycoside hydrolase family 5 protein [Acidobacteria bacterium]|nr:glycoside hydrolase family 5 protein [Acidobacteriota bacterium]